MTEPAITFDGVEKRYGPTVAVKDIDLEIRDNEFFTLLGPSGSGKTTLLRLLGGFEHPTAGRIEIKGRDVTDDPPQERTTNTVFQNYSLFPHMTVGENVSYGLRIQDIDKQEQRRRVEETLSMLEIDNLADRDIGQLSGGQQQRVALARSLVLEPEIFLLDEPLSALDEQLRQDMQVELKNLQERLGITFVYVTHDQEEAITMSDRIAVLESGNLVEVGPPQELYQSPSTVFTAGFLGTGNIMDATDVTFDGETATARVKDTQVRVRAGRCAPDSPPYAVCVRPEGLRIESRDTKNALRGTVTDEIYVGSGYKYLVSLETDGETLEAFSNRPIEHAEGETVTLGWHTEDGVLVDRR